MLNEKIRNYMYKMVFFLYKFIFFYKYVLSILYSFGCMEVFYELNKVFCYCGMYVMMSRKI